MLINTARGALIDARAAIDALKTQDHLSYLGIDVYEEEGPLFFTDRSSTIIQDDVFRASDDFAKCCDNRPSGVPDARSADTHCRDYADQHKRLSIGAAKSQTIWSRRTIKVLEEPGSQLNRLRRIVFEATLKIATVAEPWRSRS